jgi:hypothetical protein
MNATAEDHHRRQRRRRHRRHVRYGRDVHSITPSSSLCESLIDYMKNTHRADGKPRSRFAGRG